MTRKRINALTKRIKAIRLALGLTQRAAAERIGVHPSSWIQWEHGHKEPTRSHMKLIELLEAGKI